MVMSRKGRMGESLIFGERLVVAVLVATAVCAGFRLEPHIRPFYRKAVQTVQHVLQHSVVFELQLMRADLHRDVTVSQMVGRTRQGQWRVRHNSQYGLGGGMHDNKLPVVGDENIAVMQHGSLIQHQGDLLAVVQPEPLPAAATVLEGQLRFGGVADQGLSDRCAMQALVDGAHDQNKK
jgi:hypothetical protein